jgi:hypothetical protein
MNWRRMTPIALTNSQPVLRHACTARLQLPLEFPYSGLMRLTVSLCEVHARHPGSEPSIIAVALRQRDGCPA